MEAQTAVMSYRKSEATPCDTTSRMESADTTFESKGNETASVAEVDMKWSPACCVILCEAYKKYSQPLDPKELESLVQKCREVSLNDGFPVSKCITVDEVKDWFIKFKQSGDWTTQSLIILYEAFSKNPWPNDDEVLLLCKQCQDAGDSKMTCEDIKRWFEENVKHWSIKKSDYLGKTDFRIRFHFCGEFSHSSSTPMSSEGFLPVHCWDHLENIKKHLAQCLPEKRKQIIEEIRHEIEVVEYVSISATKLISQIKTDLIEVEKAVFENWNVEKIVKSIINPLQYDCLSPVQFRSGKEEKERKNDDEEFVVVFRKGITEFGVNNHLEQVLHYLIGEEGAGKKKYHIKSIHHIGSYNSYAVVLNQSMKERLRYSADIRLIESIHKGRLAGPKISSRRQKFTKDPIPFKDTESARKGHVAVYIVDSGIDIQNSDFDGRAFEKTKKNKF